MPTFADIRASFEAARSERYTGRAPAARDQLIRRAEEILEELNVLERHETFTQPQTARWNALMREAREITSALTRPTRLAEIRAAADAGTTVTGSTGGELGPGVQHYGPSAADTDPTRGNGTRDRARRLVEAAHRSGRLADHGAERVEALVTQGTPTETDHAARWALATGADAYVRAFGKLVCDPVHGNLTWTAEEAEAFRAAAAIRTEQRAMSLSPDTAGGFLVPFELDPSINLTSAGSSDPMRELARVVQVTTDTWNGVSSAGATAEWKAEAAQAADNSPVLAQPTVPVWLGSSFVPVSVELFMDSNSFMEELAPVVLDAAAQLQAAAFWRGTGTGQPTGLLTGLGAGQKVATAAADVLALADVLKPMNALGPRFQADATWGANLQVINTIGSFETTSGSLRFPEVANGRLANRDLREVSSCDNPGATAAAGNDEVLVFGSFAKGYVIADRIGATLELLPHLFGPAGRPTGQRGAWLWFRTGGNIVVPEAFRLLTA